MNMTAFRETCIKIVNLYRSLLKKNLSPREQVLHVKLLDISVAKVKAKTDVELFLLGKSLLAELETGSAKNFEGSAKVTDLIKAQLADYSIVRGKILNSRQQTARALISAIQLAKLPENKCSKTAKKELAKHKKVVAKLGTDEQKRILEEALQYLLVEEMSLVNAVG
jgi:hypothetical protein